MNTHRDKAPPALQRRFRSWAAALAAVACLLAPLAQAAELIVVDQPFCPHCRQFEAEIAKAWPNTEEGRLAPLRHVGLFEEWPADLVNVTPANVTPTFILVQDGKEVDRLVGYAGDEHFWFLIGKVLKQLDEKAEG